MPKFQCQGWWEQTGLGRQPMEQLEIEIDSIDGMNAIAGGDRRIRGAGVDMVGVFQMRGTICGDAIEIKKQYLGKHLIEYRGTADGEGVYAGLWRCSGMPGGKWAIRFRQMDGERPRMQQIKPLGS